MANPFDQFDAQKANPFDEFDPSSSTATPVFVDVVGQLATGIVKGVPNVLDLGRAVIGTTGDYVTGNTPEGGSLQNFQKYMQDAPFNRGVDTLLGTKETPPQTTLGKYANFAGQGLATAPLLGGTLAQGAAAGLLSSMGGDVGKASGLPAGEVIGSMAGGVAGATAIGPLTQRAKNLTQRLAAPKISQETAALAQRAQGFGVPLSVNQIAPTRFGNTVQKVSQEIPFSGVGPFDDAQYLGWNKALAKEAIGMDVDALNPKAVRGFLDKVDKDYTDALAGTSVRISKEQLSRFDDIGAKTDVLPDAFKKPVLDKIKSVKSQIANGFVKGEKANNLRKELMAAAGRAGPEVKDYFNEMAATLGDVVMQGLPAEKAALLAQTNRYYRNFKTVEPLLEKSVDGIVNPTQLQQRVATSKYIRGNRVDSGDDALVDLGRIGAMIPKLGGSDTAQKTILMQAAGAIGATGGAAIDPASTLAVLGANRGYQTLYNQNPNMIKAAIEKSNATAEREARKAAFKATKSNKKSLIDRFMEIENKAGSQSGSMANPVGLMMKDKLPTDHASRMARAREMGFDVDNPVYHGTNKSFNELNVSPIGTFGKGSYLAKSPEYANEFTKGTGANIQKNVIRGEVINISDLLTQDNVSGLVKMGFDQNKLQSISGRSMSIGEVLDEIAKAEGKDYGYSMTEIGQRAKKAGFAGIGDNREVAIFDPKNIRSVNAQFDPAKANSADLLASRPEAGITAAGLAGYNLTPKEEQEARKKAFNDAKKSKAPVKIYIKEAKGK